MHSLFIGSEHLRLGSQRVVPKPAAAKLGKLSAHDLVPVPDRPSPNLAGARRCLFVL